MALSTYPADFFKSSNLRRRMGYCFVLMPFSLEMNEVFRTIRDSVEGDPWNFHCQRADDFFAGGHILADVLRGIEEAELLVADLTGRNPNVFYELGIAHMVKQPSEIILLTQDIGGIPFDLQPLRCIPYTQTMDGGRKLKDDLRKAFDAMAQPVFKFEVRQGYEHQFRKRLLGEENCLYDFSVRAHWLGENACRLILQVRRFAADTPIPDDVYKGEHAIAKDTYLKVPKIAWELTLDRVIGDSAQLRLVRHSEPKNGGSTPMGSTLLRDITVADFYTALAAGGALRDAGLK
jgi:hypothetical protein